MGLTVRQTLARRRWLLLGVLTALPILMALLTRAYARFEDEPLALVAGGLSDLLLTGIVPIIALILANAALGSEVEDGTVTYLLTKPIPRWHLALSKLVTTAVLTAICTAVSAFASGGIIMRGLDATHLVLGIAAAAALGSILYSALFLALSLITRRGMLVGLVYLIVWEGALSRLFAGTRTLSVRQYMLSLMDRITTVDAEVFTALLPFSTAWQMGLVVGVAAFALCVVRLRDFELGQAG